MFGLRPRFPAFFAAFRPGEAGEDEQVGGADLQQEGTGIVGESADRGGGQRAE